MKLENRVKLAFVLPVSQAQILNIENQELDGQSINLNANGTESGTDETVIFVFEDARKVLDKEIPLKINFKSPISSGGLGSVPNNPFIVVDGDRQREIHLPDLPPTSKGKRYLGQDDDYSNENTGRYKTKNNLPWVLNFYSDFAPPPEKVSIDKKYSNFIPWANSGGKQYKEWYKN